MEQWYFLEEQSEAGIPFRLGRLVPKSTIYRFEPLAFLLQRNAAGEFRKTMAERSRILSVCKNQGLLRLEGPFSYENRLWVGWQHCQGQSAFSQGFTGGEVGQLIQDLLPLIRAYELTHLAGLVIGVPDWGRLVRTVTGFHLPDPWIKNYLTRPTLPVPPGLDRVFPPEISQGKPHDLNSDRFYLGLLLYTIICGKIPYPLRKGWPRGIAAGKSVPLVYHQPRLNPELSYLIEDLLSPNPEDRPPLREIRLRWQELVTNKTHVATSQAFNRNRRQSHSYFIGLKFFKLFDCLKIPLAIALVSLGLGWWYLQERPEQPAEIFIRDLFQSPTAVSLWLNSTGSPRFIEKFSAEQKKRRRLIMELTTRPYVELQAIKVVAREGKKSTLQLSLKWWLWEDGVWRQEVNKERIVLKKNGNSWNLVTSGATAGIRRRHSETAFDRFP